jgi:hypothetical protein
MEVKIIIGTNWLATSLPILIIFNSLRTEFYQRNLTNYTFLLEASKLLSKSSDIPIISRDTIINSIDKNSKETTKEMISLLSYSIIKDINKDFLILERDYKVCKGSYNLYYKSFDKIYFWIVSIVNSNFLIDINLYSTSPNSITLRSYIYLLKFRLVLYKSIILSDIQREYIDILDQV